MSCLTVKDYSLIVRIIILCILISIVSVIIVEDYSYNISADISLSSDNIRQMDLSDIDISMLFTMSEELSLSPGELLCLFHICNLPVNQKTTYKKSMVYRLRNRMIRSYGKEYGELVTFYEALLSDVKYFPVPESICTDKWVSYVNSWNYERTYGGVRPHEGTDIMADINERGRYPVVSVCDGVVEKMGWLEKGGWRIGIRSNNGVYFYYAHLHSYADIKEGDTVKAGEIIGFMGDSGYSVVEGTVGKFDVHLHFGIYYGEEETSYNPYWIIKYLENNILYYDY